jgi:pyridoxal phosphate enzyme (YggS family)
MDAEAIIAANLQRVREQIADAAQRAGRQPEETTLVGVTKYVDAAAAQALFDAGCHDLGESRPQSLWEKAESLVGLPIRWHMIGHLQRNKVKRTLPFVTLLHAGDSLRLLEAVDVEAAALGLVVDVLLEVNISGDISKHGFRPDELRAAFPQIAALGNLKVRGLMTMAALEGGPQRARRDFAALRELRDTLQQDCPPSMQLQDLSMGMSEDFVEAIQEGATIVRIGSALWEGLEHDRA